ncbi:tetratricopeptide repeat protein [Empedobacter tilapiae]
MDYSRRRFIYTSSLSFISFSIFSPFIKANNLLNISFQDLDELLKNASNARKLKNYPLSESIYNQILGLYPTEERAYFGLRKTFILQKKYINILHLFEDGITKNPNNPSLIAQLAKEYSSIALGNKKLVKELNYNFSLLDRSRELYEKATSLYVKPQTLSRGQDSTDSGGENNAEIGLAKTEQKIDAQAIKIDARDNVSLKQTRKSNQISARTKFIILSEAELISKLNILLTRPFNIQRNKEIKAIYFTLIRKYKKDNRITDQYNYALKLYNFDTTDPYSLFLIKKAGIRASQYNSLDIILKQNAISKNTAWSRLSYIDFLLLKYRQTNQVDLPYLNNLIESLNITYSLTPNLIIEKNFREIEYNLVTRNFSKTKDLLLAMASDFRGTKNVHNIICFSKYFSSYYILIGDKDIATSLVNQILSSNNITYTDELASKINQLINLKSIYIQKDHHIKDLVSIKNSIQNNQSFY